MAILQHHYPLQGQQVMMGLPSMPLTSSANRLQIHSVIRLALPTPIIRAAPVKKNLDLVNQIEILL